MSDNCLRLIPTDPAWLPEKDSLARALDVLTGLVPAADEVEGNVYQEVTFIDQGENFERLSWPGCAAELEIDWWSERMEHASATDFADLAVTTPCCSATTTLNDLVYDWPAGFAMVELSVLNPGRDWLDDGELAAVAAALGNPVRQVMAHY